MYHSIFEQQLQMKLLATSLFCSYVIKGLTISFFSFRGYIEKLRINQSRNTLITICNSVVVCLLLSNKKNLLTIRLTVVLSVFFCFAVKCDDFICSAVVEAINEIKFSVINRIHINFNEFCKTIFNKASYN